ncbi:hypothetical protein GCM10011584_03190 [Nocardioides phosphati]|uniref:DUF6752 domain-containing protein n=1 Tax=Nocardioides phosphati TaxID=1867775 RepID=A0ABQ2N505_9ACTN|nr:DUF6752 domain-containing protein [Nocardioides phosphati]GGO84784.1 hypothetical protein GCM10011584_03190 [Nocardioides phosphati]
MESVKQRAISRRTLRNRVKVLEQEVQECRRVNLRVAELCDVMMELLLPVQDRDEKAVAEILDRYREGVGDPLKG